MFYVPVVPLTIALVATAILLVRRVDIRSHGGEMPATLRRGALRPLTQLRSDGVARSSKRWKRSLRTSVRGSHGPLPATRTQRRRSQPLARCTAPASFSPGDHGANSFAVAGLVRPQLHLEERAHVAARNHRVPRARRHLARGDAGALAHALPLRHATVVVEGHELDAHRAASCTARRACRDGAAGSSCPRARPRGTAAAARRHRRRAARDARADAVSRPLSRPARRARCR